MSLASLSCLEGKQNLKEQIIHFFFFTVIYIFWDVWLCTDMCIHIIVHSFSSMEWFTEDFNLEVSYLSFEEK